jgi:hypothetical protein
MVPSCRCCQARRRVRKLVGLHETGIRNPFCGYLACWLKVGLFLALSSGK